MGNCHPEKTNVDRGEAEVDIGVTYNYPEKTNVDRGEAEVDIGFFEG